MALFGKYYIFKFKHTPILQFRNLLLICKRIDNRVKQTRQMRFLNFDYKIEHELQEAWYIRPVASLESSQWVSFNNA